VTPALPGPAPRPLPTDARSDLRSLLEEYERSLILAALATVGGRQRSAAALLRILPTTLNEKMKRLGIGRHRPRRVTPPGGDEARASLRWTGALAPGGTLEIRGLNGPIRVEAWSGDDVEVLATRHGARALLSALEVKVVEHAGGVTVCAVCQGPEAASPRNDLRLLHGVASVRVDFLARVGPGAHVVASTVNDDIEVVGLCGNVDAGTANGHVRFLPAVPAENGHTRSA
jgi:regulatory Fis family protein